MCMCDAIHSNSACFFRQKHCLQLVHLVLSFFNTFWSKEYRLFLLFSIWQWNANLTGRCCWWWCCRVGGLKPTFFSLRRAFISSLMLSFNFSHFLSLVKMSINYHCANFSSRRCVMRKSSERRKTKQKKKRILLCLEKKHDRRHFVFG